MLSIQGLVTGYGSNKRVLDDVSLSLEGNQVLAVLGSNGAGKSTLLRAISGTLGLHGGEVVAGSIELEGRSLRRMSAASVARAGIVQSPEGRQVFGRMTVEENLRVGGHTTPRSRRAAARDRVLTLFPRLGERASQRAGLLSGGEQQMLAIGRALMADPKVLLLDEPSLGLAPLLIDQIGEIVTEIHQQGTPVILVEQNAAMALRVAHEAVVLETGRVAMKGSAAELACSDDISALYLGGHGGHAETGHAETGHAEGTAATGAAATAPRRSLGRWAS